MPRASTETPTVKRIGVVTVGRTDWSLWRPILDRLRDDPVFEIQLYVTGTHLSPEFGMTIQEILKDGFSVQERLEILLSSDSPQGIAKATGLGVIAFAQAFARSRPDLLLVLGDRFETLAAVTAAALFTIPIAHIHGGETTQGNIDELFRHAITKMSHLHFAATEIYADRIRRMGEEAWRVHVTGAPGIDAMQRIVALSRDELCRRYGLEAEQPFLLATYHSVTLEHEHAGTQLQHVLQALEQVALPMLLTYPNADASSRTIIELLKTFERTHRSAKLVMSMGLRDYVSAMRHAAAMVGNSSSGMIEAATWRLPVVNIGHRQQGRLRPRNVIDVGDTTEEIVAGIRAALRPAFRRSLQHLKNPYGDGTASERIVRVLRDVRIEQRLITKIFADGPSPTRRTGMKRRQSPLQVVA